MKIFNEKENNCVLNILVLTLHATDDGQEGNRIRRGKNWTHAMESKPSSMAFHFDCDGDNPETANAELSRSMLDRAF